MTISGTAKTKAVKTSYPSVSGLVAETTKTAGRKMNLVPTKGSNIPQRRKQGL